MRAATSVVPIPRHRGFPDAWLMTSQFAFENPAASMVSREDCLRSGRVFIPVETAWCSALIESALATSPAGCPPRPSATASRYREPSPDPSEKTPHASSFRSRIPFSVLKQVRIFLLEPLLISGIAQCTLVFFNYLGIFYVSWESQCVSRSKRPVLFEHEDMSCEALVDPL
ncbi:MAG: hypothetical protein A4E42_01851 [Methanoregulaceae archaeon PtaU1.Bin222]|nr:MAG: hypothetical protein A4E42_01851 [Methanoregulaceae archaeon PtaU1.Bin222]